MQVIPIQYEQADCYFMAQTNAHWVHTEVSLLEDVQHWKCELPEVAKFIIGNTTKLFTQVEGHVADYWTNVPRWFQIPEIRDMATACSHMESIHTRAYANLNETLGIPEAEYDEFMTIPALKNKLEFLINASDGNLEEIACSLAVFSAFAEGCGLFSTFALLIWFNQPPMHFMPGLKQTIEWSARDESLHSECGIWLFRTLIEEHPELWNDSLKEKCYSAAEQTAQLEDAYLDYVFGPYEDALGLQKSDLKRYIRSRINMKLNEIGLKKIFDEADTKNLLWFDEAIASEQNSDFFARKPTNYAKGNDWDNVWT
jgi:ribonucleoside-diphosphate reductase beta chain